MKLTSFWCAASERGPLIDLASPTKYEAIEARHLHDQDSYAVRKFAAVPWEEWLAMMKESYETQAKIGREPYRDS